MNQRAVYLLHGFGKVADSLAVDAQGQLFLALGAVDIGVGGAVDNQFYIVVVHEVGNRLARSDIQLGHIGEEPCMPRLGRQQSHVGPQLSV